MNLKPATDAIRRVRKSVSRQKQIFDASGFAPYYMWHTRADAFKFWMINSLMPQDTKNGGLIDAIRSHHGRYVIHVGCGKNGETLKDLQRLGYGNLIGIDNEVPFKDYIGIEFIAMDLQKRLPIKDHAIEGVVFTSYIFPTLEPEKQLQLLEEIDRVTGKGSSGFLGPILPQQLDKSAFSSKFPGAKNPLFGYLQTLQGRKNERWTLWRSRAIAPHITDTVMRSPLQKLIPLVQFTSMGGSAVSTKVLGHSEVVRDYHVHIPNEFFITFSKD